MTGYQVYRGAEEVANLGASATTYSDTGLAAGDYSYRVRALDAAGNPSDFSDPAGAIVPDTTKPSAPENLVGAANGSTQVDLTWDESTDDVGVTDYRVYRDGTEVATTPSTSHSDLVAPGTYDYTVRALDEAGNESDTSNVATVTVTLPDLLPPGPPGNLTATVSAGDVNLSWEAATDDVGVSEYRIYRGDQLVATGAGNELAYTDTPAPGTYTYTVRAVDAAGHTSDPSNGADATVLDTEPPTSPENLTATAVSPSQIDLAWDAAADNVEVSGYEIYRDDALLTTIGPATSYSDGVIAPATHTYEVRALDAAGNRSDPSNSATASVTPPDLEDPGPPGNLQATVTATGDVDLTWDAATDNVGVTAYRIYRDDQLLVTVGATTSHTDLDVPLGDHRYEVRAVDAAGRVSDASNPADVTVTDTQAPSAPANLSATAVSPSQIDLAWEPATDDVAVTAYEIHRDGALLTTIGPATSYSDGVIAPATHTYEVRALDAAGNRSDPSNSDTATVVPPDTEAPTPPGTPDATVTGNQVHLSWSASLDTVGVTGYHVYRDNQLLTTVGTTSYTDTGLAARHLQLHRARRGRSGQRVRTQPRHECEHRRHREADRSRQSERDGRWSRAGEPHLAGGERQRAGDGLRRLPGRTADRGPRRGHLLHRHRPARRLLHLHRARARRGREPVGSQQRRHRDRAGHDQPDRAGEPAGDRAERDTDRPHVERVQ